MAILTPSALGDVIDAVKDRGAHRCDGGRPRAQTLTKSRKRREGNPGHGFVASTFQHATVDWNGGLPSGFSMTLTINATFGVSQRRNAEESVV